MKNNREINTNVNRTAKIKVTRRQVEATCTCSYSDDPCPDCGGKTVVDSSPDFAGSHLLKTCSVCGWKNYEVISA